MSQVDMPLRHDKRVGEGEGKRREPLTAVRSSKREQGNQNDWLGKGSPAVLAGEFRIGPSIFLDFLY